METKERLIAQVSASPGIGPNPDPNHDEEFFQLLYKGGELLLAGKAPQAKEILEKAVALQPKNQKARNLLGLTCFKLGIFDRAAQVYETLVHENPSDPTLRVNLGLVYLKNSSLQMAIREFESAVELAPDHKKAQNYLGLAYAQAGKSARARDCFIAAGSVAMAEKMEKAIQDASKAQKIPALESPALESKDVGIDNVPVKKEARSSSVSLDELSRIAPLTSLNVEPFDISSDRIAIRVQEKLHTRLEGIIGAAGSIQYAPEMKRFRGQGTDKAFGEAERRVVRASGNGVIFISPKNRIFTAIKLADEQVYFIENALFAFEESVSFENGRVPSKFASDLHLVHLCGSGKVLLSSPTQLRTIAISQGAQCAIPIAVLVGWWGALTPRITDATQEREGLTPIPCVELNGQGFAVLADKKA